MDDTRHIKDSDFSHKLKQIFLLLLILLVVYISIVSIAAFIPGLLGGITLFFIARDQYLALHVRFKMKNVWAAFIVVFAYLLITAGLVYLLVRLIQPQIYDFSKNYEQYMQSANEFFKNLSDRLGFELLSETNISDFARRVADMLPSVINSTVLFLSNFAIAFIVMYYMLVRTETLEKFLVKTIPFKKTNIEMVGSETKKMVKANAIGIPLICIIQGVTATLGYWIFGVPTFGLWGVLTGVFAFFPIIGTTIIWVPVCAYLYISGQTWEATGLVIYSLVVTGNVDYLARVSILRRMADIHPLITLFGVLAGLYLFGFMGFIFGPLLISYILILGKVYISEFV